MSKIPEVQRQWFDRNGWPLDLNAVYAENEFKGDGIAEIQKKYMAHLDGGPGSGNWGHAGRPGIGRGGSAAGTGGKKNRLTMQSGGFTSINNAYKENEKWNSNPENQKKLAAAKKANAEKHANGTRNITKADEDILEKHIFGVAKTKGVISNAVKRLEKPLTEEQIIGKISGGDMTDGSCVSVALTYAANKLGLDVNDFRGGKSRELFCCRSNTRNLYKVSGVKSQVIQGDTKAKAGKAALATMEEGKEYILHCGRHAAIVRVKDGVKQYLELQDPRAGNNGWTDFSNKASDPHSINKRFGASNRRSATEKYFNLQSEAIITDISTLNYKGFSDVMGLINTSSDKQKKGTWGNVK